MSNIARDQPSRIRVGVDGRAFASPAAGVRRYVRELVGALPAVDPEIEILAIGAPPDLQLPAGVGAIRATPILPTNLGWTQTALPLGARRARLDLFHAPAYTAPLWGVHPLVLTIHDVSYARHPEWYPYRRDALRRAFYRRSALAADLIVTDSEFSRGEIVAAYSIDPTRIDVIPLGVGEPFAPAAPDRPTALPPGIRRPYVLHVGEVHPRRNLATALDAILLLRQRHESLRSLQLVLAGADRGSASDLTRRAGAAGQPQVLSFVTSAGDEALANLYRSADAFVYPSRYEGFGLPVLEAMACGTPVVAARAAAIPEVVGSAGLLVPPEDVQQFADALATVLLDPAVAGRLRETGLRRAADLTWRRAAEGTLRTYRRCLGRPAPG